MTDERGRAGVWPTTWPVDYLEAWGRSLTLATVRQPGVVLGSTFVLPARLPIYTEPAPTFLGYPLLRPPAERYFTQAEADSFNRLAALCRAGALKPKMEPE